ncbi:excinuclease ABC subunit UvrC [Propionibacterium freudenreichii]|uniref:UvrABC system protein C n=1 Tax=Propionibacterium freudenreichii TaxID=1744 RepID=A0A2C7AR16_9ACTN|nr:excinuclease ABC subunit UvrC [Propionibacterium freudenreichii]CUW16707.1 Excinuclease ABC subunit C [Propionibacterium freudenreichii subsp. shermanii]SPB30816.1 UvrABC system protein C [Propionibacterium freudenreichii subsp. shermanii]SPS08930.1 UvrABC system protein C [Propionibacterium freudenreichii subsp. shermanii]
MADPSTYRPAPGSIPTDPGVYRFSDEHGQVIYVGKAKNLRNRLNSYFHDISALHPRTQRMVRTAAHVQWTVVQNELESLQLEYTWIKQYDPRFNIMYRDDKTYPWLCVTWSDEYPRVYVGRGAKRKGYRYFGPFGQAWAVRDTVDMLLRIFPMRSCSAGVFRNAQAAGRPCLLGYIGKCSAPCVGRVSAAEHREIADDFCSFWEGRTRQLQHKLTKQMRQAAENEEFERAAVLRDSLGALDKATERNAVVLPDGTDADAIAFALDPLELAVQVFHVRGGRIRGERSWIADRADDADESELVESFLLQLYSDSRVPHEILVPVMPPTAPVLTEMLGEQRGGRVNLHVPQRGDKRVLLDTVAKNATEALDRHKAKRAADLATRNQALEELQGALGLPEVPLRIEGYDISHLQGTQVVGSMVVFEDGLSRRSEYRRFVIKSFEGSDDLRAMDEVLTRRFSRLINDRRAMEEASRQGGPGLIDPETGKPLKFAYAPSLVVIDGGPLQVEAAQNAITTLGLAEVRVIGLAKRLEEVWLPDQDFPLILPRDSEGLYLLQRVRDESHRFAITHHRQRRSRAMVESVLDDVPGLGAVRRKTVLSHFGSLRKLRAATVDQIAELPGLGAATAQAIVDALRADQPGQAINVTTGEIVSEGPAPHEDASGAGQPA